MLATATVSCKAQPSASDITKYKQLFNHPFDGRHAATELLWKTLISLPKQKSEQVITALAADASITNTDTGRVKLDLLKLHFTRINNGYYANRFWRTMCPALLRQATLTRNDYLLQSCCVLMGDTYLYHNNSDTAVFYLLKAAGLLEPLGYKPSVVQQTKISVSNALYRTQNYAECIAFCGATQVLQPAQPLTVITAYNNTGLGYLKLAKPDSAFYFFKKAALFAASVRLGVWEGIASGNMGDALHAMGKDAEAVRYWQTDYDSCLKYREWGNAGLTLAYLAQHQFNEGQRSEAMKNLAWAVSVNEGDAVNLLRIYSIKAACLRRLGTHDSADYFLQASHRLNDSINRAAVQSNYTTLQLRMAYEQSVLGYEVLQRQRQAEVVHRNLFAVALLCLGVIAALLFSRQRLKVKLARGRQALAESETASAREQLALFMQTVLEKNEQIEKLNASLHQQQAVMNDDLIQQTLLTDYDWNKFKELFEKTHPGFFARLKTLAQGVTPAEMRLAALIKLNLSTKQMASMQGISVSSLRGNKTRLRQKLALPPEADLEQLLHEL